MDDNKKGRKDGQMKLKIFVVMVLWGILTYPAASLAAGGCPQSADRLEGFAGCVVPVRGGAVLGASGRWAGHLDSDHRNLMAAMERNDGVPPQVIPPAPVSYPLLFAPYAYIYTAVGTRGYIWGSFSVPYYRYGYLPYVR